MTLTLPIQLDPASPPDETLHVTVSGRPVRIYAIDGSEPAPIHGAIYIDGRWEPRSWLAGGGYERSGAAHAFDLRDRAPVKRGYWIGVYTKGEQRFAGTFPSKRDALAFDGGDGWRPFGVHYLAEGDGLDTRADPPLWVDWAELPHWAKWAAADENGRAHAYEIEPRDNQSCWHSFRRWTPLLPDHYRLAPGFKWDETLTPRPEGV